MNITNAITYIQNQPVKATLKLKLRPEWSFNENNADDVAFQLVMHLVLMGCDNDQLNDLMKAGNSLDELFKIFNNIASAINKNTAQKSAQEKELKKLKKLIHAFAHLQKHNTKENNQQKIINLEKLLERYKRNFVKNTHFSNMPYVNFARTCSMQQDNELLYKYTDNTTKKLTQKYAVVTAETTITPISTDEERTIRKTHKSRINKFSFAISLIVGIGEGLIAAVFAVGTFSFLPALLLIGIPAAICNYYLFRGDSFDVLKQIWFGKSTDKPLTKAMKIFSTISSAGAGIAYGFLSFGSATIGIGHLFFGLSAAAAMAAPPVALIVIAAVVAVVTAIALTTLYDFMIRKWINEGIVDKLKVIKTDVVDFFKRTDNKLTALQKCAYYAKKVAKVGSFEKRVGNAC